MKRADSLNIFLSLLFVLMLIAPHVFRSATEATSSASLENRSKATPPDVSLLFTSFSDHTSQLGKSFNDSFGLRQHLIRWNNLLRLKLFGESPVTSVRVGLDGWYFYANEWVFDDYENVMPYKEEDLQKIVRILKERNAWLQARGIQFFILVAPNKHTVYSEYLPPRIRKIGKESRLDQVARALASHPDIHFLDVRPALQRAKTTQRLYHRTDTHWNDYGAFMAYEQLMERIARHFPAVRKLSLDDYTVSIEPREGGDLAGLLSLKDVIGEERVTLTPRFTPRAKDATRPYADPVDLEEYPGREMVIKETGEASRPRALIFRDSFSWPLIPFLAESFQSSVFIWKFDFLADIIDKEKPDVVILECVERYLNALTIENPPEVRGCFP